MVIIKVKKGKERRQWVASSITKSEIDFINKLADAGFEIKVVFK